MQEEKLYERVSELQEQLRQGKIPRRDFLRYATLLGLSVGAAEALAACAPKPTPTPPPPPPPTPTPAPPAPTAPTPAAPVLEMPLSKGVIVVDVDKCTGCRSCEIVCSLYHEGVINPALSRIHVVKDWRGADSSIEARFLPATCRQCAIAKCADVCPVGAIVADPKTNARIVDEEKCIGCGLCVEACPYTPSRIALNEKKKTAFKCDLCGGDPMCIKICNSGALIYQFSEEGIV